MGVSGICGDESCVLQNMQVKLVSCIKKGQAREKPGQYLVSAFSVNDQSNPIREYTALPSRNIS